MDRWPLTSRITLHRPGNRQMSSVQEINSIEELAGYRLLWNRLLSDTREASFFQSLDWLEVYWQHFGADQKLRVLIVYSGDQPIGILPLVVRQESTRIGTLRVLTYPLSDWGSFYGPIGPNPTATLLAGLSYISRCDRDWDVVELRWVNNERCDFRRTEQAMRSAGIEGKKQAWRQAALIDLDGTWDEYLASRSSKWRKDIRTKERKLAKRGTVELVRYRPEGTACGDGDPRWDLYEMCEQIAQRSWQGASTTGTTMTHDKIRGFLRDVHVRACHVGAVDMNVLLVDGEPAAFSYQYHYQGYVNGLRMGFDPEFAKQGAGTVMMGRMIEDSFARGDRTLDLGTDYLECKRHWVTSIAGSYRYSHYAGTGRAQVLRAKRLVDAWWRSGHDVAPQSVSA